MSWEPPSRAGVQAREPVPIYATRLESLAARVPRARGVRLPVASVVRRRAGRLAQAMVHRPDAKVRREMWLRRLLLSPAMSPILAHCNGAGIAQLRQLSGAFPKENARSETFSV